MLVFLLNLDYLHLHQIMNFLCPKLNLNIQLQLNLKDVDNQQLQVHNRHRQKARSDLRNLELSKYLNLHWLLCDHQFDLSRLDYLLQDLPRKEHRRFENPVLTTVQHINLQNKDFHLHKYQKTK